MCEPIEDYSPEDYPECFPTPTPEAATPVPTAAPTPEPTIEASAPEPTATVQPEPTPAPIITELAYTGFQTTTLIAVAMLLLLVGAALIRSARYLYVAAPKGKNNV